MKICLLEPFYAGSHQRWADGFQKHSSHQVEILSLPGRHWKWRMHGGAVALADQFNSLEYQPDLILATDMLDFAVFLGLTNARSANIPTAIYFHENQLTYLWSPSDSDPIKQRDNHYSFINYTSALVADAVFFNSNYHKTSFCSALKDFLMLFPDEQGVENITKIVNKSKVLHLGMNLKAMDTFPCENKNLVPHLLWNHRWEYDKNPELFFETLISLSKMGKKFKLSVVGEQYRNSPDIFKRAQEKLAPHILHFGFLKSSEEYNRLLSSIDILPVTSNQDFFGGSVVEAIYAGAFPLLPNRLAYPEHIPDEFKAQHFFTDEKDFKEKLAALIDGFKPGYKNDALVNFVSRYDWANLVEYYDNSFQKLILV